MGVSKFCLTTAKNYGIYLSRKEAREFRVKFFQLYPGIARYHAAIRRQWQQGARSSYTLDGRRRLWKGKNPPTLNELLNHPVQGTSATITKRAIALFDEWVNKHRLTAMIIAVIHDEIVVECNSSEVVKTAKLLQQCMVSAARPLLAPIPVEVDVQVGQSWGG
jgi:DNA polymerase-1